MLRPKFVQLVALLLCAGLVYSATRFAPSINEGRRALNMFGSDSPLENAPPEYAFLVQAFGAFRSLLTDIAFIRAEEYKSQGRYYDAMQLHNWICKLQPRFPSVWEYCAWNMAWNISVTTYTAEERWNWVYNGAKLIRDEGLRFNPRAVNLYKQLAWIFLNKMGESVDEYHLDYKRNWAWRMHLVLGPPPDTYGEYRPDKALDAPEGGVGTEKDTLLEAARIEAQRRAEKTGLPALDVPKTEQELQTAEVVAKKAALDRIKAIEAAPHTLAELYAQTPETREMVAKLRDLGVDISNEPLTEDKYWLAGGLADTFFARYRRLTDPPSLLVSMSRGKKKDEAAEAEQKTLEEFDRILGARAHNPAGEALVRFLQRKTLTEVYKLDPAHMVYLMETFGPIDWRVVGAQGLYWCVLGILKGQETLSTFRNDKTNTARLIFNSLRNLWQNNKLTFEPYPDDLRRSYINPTPDINFIEPMHQAYITYAPMIDPDPGRGGAGETFRSGHVNFLSEAIVMLYLADRELEAQKYYDYLREHYGTKDDGTREERYLQPLRDYVMNFFYEGIEGGKETRNAIFGLLWSAYKYLGDGDFTRYNKLAGKAFELYDAFMKDKAKETSERMKLNPFPELQAEALASYLVQLPPLSPGMTVHKARLWRNAPLDAKQRIYDDILPLFKDECNYWEFDVAKAFPEPPGMKEYREKNPGRVVDKPDTGIETPAQVPK